MKKNKNKFIETRDVIGQQTLAAIRRDRVSKLISGSFDIGTRRRIADKIAKRLTKDNIVKVVCAINVIIPGTFWPFTNPMIIKFGKNTSKDKIVRKYTVLKMRFNLQ